MEIVSEELQVANEPHIYGSRVFTPSRASRSRITTEGQWTCWSAILPLDGPRLQAAKSA